MCVIIIENVIGYISFQVNMSDYCHPQSSVSYVTIVTANDNQIPNASSQKQTYGDFFIFLASL